MDWKSAGQRVAKAAPLLGTVLGGPAGGAFGAVVAGALGVDNQPDAVAAAMASPEALVKLKQIEADHRAELEQIAAKVALAELKNQEHAREIHKHSPMPAIVTGALTVMVAVAGWLLFHVEIPAANRDVAYMLFGQLLGLWAASVTYWVGTTRSSAEKTRLLKSGA